MMHDIVRRTCLAIIVAAGSLVSGCALLPTDPAITTTEVTLPGPTGDRTIVCRRATAMADDACLAWGGRVLRGLPAEAIDVARLVLTDRTGTGRCSADFQDAAGAIYASASITCP